MPAKDGGDDCSCPLLQLEDPMAHSFAGSAGKSVTAFKHRLRPPRDV